MSRFVLATTEADALGGVFARAYHAAGGPPLSAVVVVPDRADLGFPRAAQPAAYWRLFGPRGIARIVRARHLRRPVARDAAAGFHLDWVSTLAAGAPVVPVAAPNAAEGVAALRALAPDVLVSVGVPVILRAAVLEVPRLGALNVHNGRLPRYRGHFGTFWEVVEGERGAWVTVHEMAPRVDAGRTVAAEAVEVASMPSFLDLMIEKKRRGGRLLASVLRHVAETGSLPAGRAAEGAAPPAEGYFPWPSPADVRAFRWPAAP